MPHFPANTLLRLLFLIGLFALVGLLPASAQVGRPTGGMPMNPGAGGPGDQVEILPPGADSLVVMNVPGQAVRQLFGKNLKFRHKGVLMFCNYAVQNATTNVLEAYGNVRIVQGDTITVKSDTMYYYGNTRQANLRGRVTMKDRKMTLTTNHLDYDMAMGVAHYPNKGRTVDRENTLTSQEGFYDTRTKQFTFRQNVRLVNPQYVLTADNLLYNSLTKIADFQGPTKIVNKDGTLVATQGQYNTVTRVSNFQQRATVETPKYTITGDSLYYDNNTDLGIARGNVVMVAKEDKTVITGNHTRYNGKLGISRVTGNAVVRNVVADKDTLFMRADTLFSYDTPRSGTATIASSSTLGGKKPVRKLVGNKNVVVYKSDLQSRCDSLVYDVADSTIYFFKKPIVWSQQYQLEADSMTAKMKHNRIDRMFLKTRSFVIARDTLQNFNQIKGRQITAYFKTRIDTVRAMSTTMPKNNSGVKNPQSRPTSTTPYPVSAKAISTSAPIVRRENTVLDRVIVEGNGQSIYFAVDDKNKLVGMNRVESSRMNIDFEDSKVGQIRFYGQPDAQFVPPQEISGPKKELDGFRWRTEEKPTKDAVLNYKPLVKRIEKNTASAKPLPDARVLNDKK
jgi:lipopolysaccharide export system protein LptA